MLGQSLIAKPAGEEADIFRQTESPAQTVRIAGEVRPRNWLQARREQFPARECIMVRKAGASSVRLDKLKAYPTRTPDFLAWGKV